MRTNFYTLTLVIYIASIQSVYADSWVRYVSQIGVIPPPRDQYSLTYNPSTNCLILAGGYDAANDVALNDIYSFDLTSRTWTTVSSSLSSWVGVRWINGVYSSASNAVLVWAGSQANYLKQTQMLVVPSSGSPYVVPNLGVQRDSYSAIQAGDSVVYYGGNFGAYFNTVYDYEAGAAALTQVQSSTSGTLPVNANAIMASTSSVNGSFVWLYDGQQTDMNLTRIALTSNSNGGGYASYVSKVFSPVGLPSWNTYYPCMACQRGTTWYIIRYYQSVAPMVYTSFIIDLKDDSNPQIRNWTITGSAPPVSSVSMPLRLACGDTTFWSWDGSTREMWSIQLDVSPTATHSISASPTSSAIVTLIIGTPTPSATIAPSAAGSSNSVVIVVVSISSVIGAIIAGAVFLFFRRSMEREKQHMLATQKILKDVEKQEMNELTKQFSCAESTEYSKTQIETQHLSATQLAESFNFSRIEKVAETPSSYYRD